MLKEQSRDWGPDGWAVPPDGGEHVILNGPHWPQILVRGDQVDGALGVFLFHHGVITENPPHAHHKFAKIAYVLKGTYEFRVGTAVFSGGPGTTVVVPRGSQHTFVTATGGKMLFVSSPAGNEELFLELGRIGPNATAAELAEINARFATTGPEGDAGRPWQQLRK